MSTSRTEFLVEGHKFTIETRADSKGRWCVEVVNVEKTAFAFDPVFTTEAEAIAHAAEALRNSDIKTWLG